MNCWIRVWEIVAIIAYLASSSAFAQQANVEAGKKEGKVGVYGSVVPQAMEGLHQAFKKKNGIDAKYGGALRRKFPSGRYRSGAPDGRALTWSKVTAACN